MEVDSHLISKRLFTYIGRGKPFMKLNIQALVIVAVMSLIPIGSIYAQTEEDLTLNLSRDFGYSSGTGKIQGTFSLHVSGPDNLASVEFLIDDEVIAEVNSPPFRYQFNTGTYSEGVHTISARGYTTDGSVLASNERRVEFVSAEVVPQQVFKIILPIFALVFIISIVSILIPTLAGKGKGSSLPLGSPRTYGMSGGAICPKCKRPFSIHLLSLNLLIGKLDRCPYCGRWSIVRRASPQELQTAEEAELDQIPESSKERQVSEEEKLKKDIDESKYQDI
jgi:hypothetical protein